MRLTLDYNGTQIRFAAVASAKGTWLSHQGMVYFVPKQDHTPRPTQAGNAVDNAVCAPMTGKIVQIAVQAGDSLEAGATLLVMEAMKMEYRLRAPRACTISEVHAKARRLVDLGALLVTLTP